MRKIFLTTLLLISGYAYTGDFTEYVSQHTESEKACGCSRSTEVLLCEDDRKAFGSTTESEQALINQFQASCSATEGFMTLKNCYCYPKTATRTPQSVDSIKEKSCTFDNAKLIKITKRGERELARCK